MRKKILLGLIAVVIVAFIAYKMIYKPHRNIDAESSSYVITASALKEAFIADAAGSNSKYSDKTITVSGIVTDYDQASNTIVLDSALSAVLQNPDPIKTNSKVTIKGRFVGYDDLLEELKMDQATLQTN